MTHLRMTRTDVPLDPHAAAINGRKCLKRRRMRRCFARFDDDQILEIRSKYEGGAYIVDLAEHYGVHRMTISAIVHYQRYGHLEPEGVAA